MQSQSLEEKAGGNLVHRPFGSVYTSLKSEVKESLSEEQEDFIHSLDKFQAPYLQEKLLTDKRFETPEEYQEAFTEFKKYIALTQLSGTRKLSMASKRVDEVWHQFILFTPQYHKFCEENLGGYLHHLPKTSYTPLDKDGKKKFIDSYRKTFGNIPSLWDIKSKSDPCDACGPDACAPDDISPM